MKKRLSFVLLIAILHLLFTLATVIGCPHLFAKANGIYVPIWVQVFLSPLYFPFRNASPSMWLIPLNSLLWGVMAERLVFGRKTVWRNTRGANR